MNKVSLRSPRVGAMVIVVIVYFGITMMTIVPSRSFAQQEDKNSTIGTYALGYDKGKLNKISKGILKQIGENKCSYLSDSSESKNQNISTC